MPYHRIVAALHGSGSVVVVVFYCAAAPVVVGASREIARGGGHKSSVGYVTMRCRTIFKFDRAIFSVRKPHSVRSRCCLRSSPRTRTCNLYIVNTHAQVKTARTARQFACCWVLANLLLSQHNADNARTRAFVQRLFTARAHTQVLQTQTHTLYETCWFSQHTEHGTHSPHTRREELMRNIKARVNKLFSMTSWALHACASTHTQTLTHTPHDCFTNNKYYARFLYVVNKAQTQRK